MTWAEIIITPAPVLDALVLCVPKVLCTHAKLLLKHFSLCCCTRRAKISIVPCKLFPSGILNINLFQVINHVERKESIQAMEYNGDSPLSLWQRQDKVSEWWQWAPSLLGTSLPMVRAVSECCEHCLGWNSWGQNQCQSQGVRTGFRICF